MLKGKQNERVAGETARLASAIQTRRKSVGLTQADLADLLGFSASQTVSDIERGTREVKAWELVKIAGALRTNVDALLGIEREPRGTRVMWRRGSGAASRETENLFVDRARRYAVLEKWNRLPSGSQFPEMRFAPDRASFNEAAVIAREVGKTLDLGSRPAASLSSVLQEGFRVKIFFEELGDDESAASAKGDFGYAILMNSAQAPWRRNYNLAHEVFHLVTWESTHNAWGDQQSEPEWFDHVEKLANAFASHLLLPSDEVSTQYQERFPDGEISYPELVEMAREFEVSTEALIWRLRLLGKLSQESAEEILNDPEFRREDRRTMGRNWREPPVGPLPPRFWRLAENAYRRGEMTLARLASMLEISVSDAGELVIGEDGQEAPATSA